MIDPVQISSSDEDDEKDHEYSSEYQNMQPSHPHNRNRSVLSGFKTPEDDSISVLSIVTGLSETYQKGVRGIGTAIGDTTMSREQFSFRVGDYKFVWSPWKQHVKKISWFRFYYVKYIIILVILMLSLALTVPEESISNSLTKFALGSFMTFTNGSILTSMLAKENDVEFQLYLWNTTNPDAVINDQAKPHIEEIGPYVFNLRSRSTDFIFNSSLHETSFKRTLNFTFNHDKTKEVNQKMIDENKKSNDHIPDAYKDVIFHPNFVSIALSRVVDTLNDMWEKDGDSWWAKNSKQMGVNMALAAIKPNRNIVENNTVYDVLIGSKSDKEIVAKLKALMKTQFKLTDDQLSAIPEDLGLISLVEHLATSTAKYTTVNDGTGENGVLDLMKIVKMGDSDVNCWHDADHYSKLQEADKIHKTNTAEYYKHHTTVQANDGIFYPPLTDINNPPKFIPVYNQEVQRTMNITFFRKTKKHNLPVLEYRYGNYSQNADLNPALKDFCSFYPANFTHKEHCQYTKGTVHLSQCILNGMPPGIPDLVKNIMPPILMSNPHFLDVTSDVAKDTTGSKPDFEDHGNYVKFEPRSGMPVELRKRIQVSIVAHRSGAYTPFVNLHAEKTALPIIWIDFTMDDPNIAKLLYKAVFIPMSIVDYMPISCFILATIALIYFIRQDYFFELIHLTYYDEFSVTDNQPIHPHGLPKIMEDEVCDGDLDDVFDGANFRPPVPERITNSSNSGVKQINQYEKHRSNQSLSSAHAGENLVFMSSNKKRGQRPSSVSLQPAKRPNRPTTLNFNNPPQSKNNANKFQRDIVTTPGLNYSIKNRINYQHKTLNSDTESVVSVMSAMVGATFQRFRLHTPMDDSERTPLIEDVQGLFEDELEENSENSIKKGSEINNNSEKGFTKKVSPSTSDSSVDSRVEATSPFTPNRSNLRKRLSHPNTPSATGNTPGISGLMSTPIAPTISTPTAIAGQFLNPNAFGSRRKHNSLSDSAQKPVGRSNSKTTNFSKGNF